MHKTINILLTSLLSFFPFFSLQAQGLPDDAPQTLQTESESQAVSGYFRQFQAPLPLSYSPEIPARMGIFGNQVFQDLNQNFLRPLIPGWVGNILSETWSIFWTYEFTIWSHEFGHWTRAAQVNSKFIFHDLNPFFPNTTVEMAENASLRDRALLSVGGFEVNSMIARQSQIELYKNNAAFADTLVHGWVNKSFFPIYAFLVIPQNPAIPETWQKTAGDPVHFILPTYQLYSGKEPVSADNQVQPDLIQYYNEAVTLSLAWELLDPLFYQTLWDGVIHKPKNDDVPIKPWILLGDDRFGWSYGTLFNPSPLGYELYFNNFFKIDHKLFLLYLKYGRPMQNLGMGINLPEIIKTDDFSAGIQFDLWQQEQFNTGMAIRADFEWFFDRHWGVFLNGGWKSAGYLLGQPLNAGVFIYSGLSFR